LGLKVIHLDVFVDEGGLPEFEDLDHNVEGDWDQVGVGDPEDEELDKEGLGFVRLVILQKVSGKGIPR
jgi:hypothetical protein